MNKNQENLEVKARKCAKIRKVQRDPQAALVISQEVIDSIEQRNDRKGFDRILCTHGGAYRQLGKSLKALHYADLAIKENPHHKHPYNLAGAACFDIGQYDRGNEYFDIARQKGATEDEIFRIKSSGLKRSKEKRKENYVYQYEEYGEYELEILAHEQEEENRLQSEEIDEYADSMEASEEEGWFYKD